MPEGLTSDTWDCLRSAGWYPGRAIDTSGYLRAWQAAMIPYSPAVLDFLREFGELTVHHPPSVVIEGVAHTDWTRFAAVDAVQGLSERMLHEYGGIAGSQLCPCGSNRSHMTLLMADSGMLFGGVDNYLFRFGVTVGEALNRICSGATPEKVGEWHI